MPERWDQVIAWRKRAAELRQKAHGCDIPSVRDRLNQVAQSYERGADDLERKLKEIGLEPRNA
jgi:hypothetical protein